MREYLFRGKNMNADAWVYGSLVPKCIDSPVSVIILKYAVSPPSEVYSCKVWPDTVGQYTGKKFKDKMCFGGDVIFARHSRLLVEWDTEFCAWWTYYFDDKGNPRRFCPLSDIALWETDGIIGNIHDNPELMGE